MTSDDYIKWFGGGLAAAAAGIGAWFAKREMKPREKSSDLERAEADKVRADAVKVAAEVYGGLIIPMQAELNRLGSQQEAFDTKADMLEKKVDENAARARAAEERARKAEERAARADARCERNIKRLQAHILRCCDMMRGASLEPPDPPTLETTEDAEPV